MVGNSNDCFGYLPTEQVVKEGGHENTGVTLGCGIEISSGTPDSSRPPSSSQS